MLSIGEVCRMLGITSRTLRYYEEKGIVRSTTDPFHPQRRYTPEQVEEIKKVLVLRSMGLSLADIRRMQQGSEDPSAVIGEHKARLLASIAEKTKELRRLEEAMQRLENGGDMFTLAAPAAEDRSRTLFPIAGQCTDAILAGEPERCFACFSPTLQSYLPLSAFCHVLQDTLAPMGTFVCREQQKCVENSVFQYLRYEKLGLLIQFSFDACDRVQGIWFQYRE